MSYNSRRDYSSLSLYLSNPTPFALGLLRLKCCLFQLKTENEQPELTHASGLTPNQEPYVSDIGLPFCF
ncbi:hypothetical protein BDV37DRAFT_89408 [Aspergillus pseudonomiae]|uniref:Uncharacterized protein n=1 Tax=Aspergillus pseudonomiae TaxID=1506151 RepID=A0A5N7DHQ1_9EURO|nr:uncharacterized protein BDV37DRAFT_89408 [Aspergillus pseudonomiae]KAE8405553.1 hypothetical protein BDV37DRAFT_89408 [Aspergillus pseudonomiae]